MTGTFKRQGAVKKLGRIADNGRATHRIVGRRSFLTIFIGNDVSAVERIIETTPARIGCIDGEACVVHGDDKLWRGDLGQFRIDVFGRNLRKFLVPLEITDLLQELNVVCLLPGGSLSRLMPRIDLLLQIIANSKQLAVMQGQVADDRLDLAPERRQVKAYGEQELRFHEFCENRINA